MKLVNALKTKRKLTFLKELSFVIYYLERVKSLFLGVLNLTNLLFLKSVKKCYHDGHS